MRFFEKAMNASSFSDAIAAASALVLRSTVMILPAIRCAFAGVVRT
jgi:hypothetical protein